MVEFELVWACDDKGGIGRQDSIPWNVPQDLRKFREITIQEDVDGYNSPVFNVVIMGRKTWESIPKMFKPLKNRFNIVITSKEPEIKPEHKNVAFVPSFELSLVLTELYLKKFPFADVFVIGGERVYNEAIKHESCIGIHETLIDGDWKCEKFIPEDLSFTKECELIEEEKLSFNASYLYWRKKGTFEIVENGLETEFVLVKNQLLIE